VLQVAPSSYYEIKNRQPSARAQRDEVMGPVVRQLWEDNYRVYGARKAAADISAAGT
jgi:putative transposase